MNLERYLRERKQEIDDALERLLPQPDGPAATVARAMRYAVLSGGKRLRPIVALACCEALAGRREEALAPAAALEMVHTYSLIHDDLPAMDDDDLRRGRPTVHRAFGEAEAILAGDALLTLALEILASEPPGEGFASRRAAAVATVARGAGIGGMVGGQMADLESEKTPPAGDRLEWIHRHKTGSLMSAAAELGAIHAGADMSARNAMARFGASLGLAFQIVDDILDVTATADTLGKTPGKDAESGKVTYPRLMGVEASRKESERLVARGLEEIAPLGVRADTLASISRFVLERTH